MFRAPVSRVFDPVLTMVAAVAVIVASLCLEPPRAAVTTVRVAAIAVELQAVTIQTALAGTAAAETVSMSDAAGSDQPTAVTAEPVDLIGGITNLAATLAGAALWFAAFPITLPASIIGGSVLGAILGYFACFCFTLPAPDVVVREGLRTFFTLPVVAVQNAIAALQPGQSVPPAVLASAAADLGTTTLSADPDAATPATGDRIGRRPGTSGTSEFAAPSPGSDVPVAGPHEVKPAELEEGKRIRVRTPIKTRPSSSRPVLPAQASALPSVSVGTPVATAGPVSRAPRRVPVGRR